MRATFRPARGQSGMTLMELVIILVVTGLTFATSVMFAKTVLGESGPDVANQAVSMVMDREGGTREVQSVLSEYGLAEPTLVKHSISLNGGGQLSVSFQAEAACVDTLMMLATMRSIPNIAWGQAKTDRYAVALSSNESRLNMSELFPQVDSLCTVALEKGLPLTVSYERKEGNNDNG